MHSNQRVMQKRSGIAVLFVLAVLCVTLAISYALSRSSVTSAALSRHETGGVRAVGAADSAITTPFINLSANPDWMPTAGTSSGSTSSDDSFQLTMEISDAGDGRTIDALAQIYEQSGEYPASGTGVANVTDVRRAVASQRLNIHLLRQARNDLPAAAIAAFASDVQHGDPPLYVAAGSVIRGDVRSHGPIYFQQGFTLTGTARVMGDVSRSGTSARRYSTYRASWGSTYQAESLDSFGQRIGQGTLQLSNVVLGPSSTNPMGVFYLKDANLVLGDNVALSGTLAVTGSVTISGTGVNLLALQQVQVPSTSLDSVGDITPLVKSVLNTNVMPLIADDEELVAGISYAVVDPVIKSTFPVLVADGDIVAAAQADAVRISGLVLTAGRFRRDSSGTVSPCGHNHSLLLDQIIDLFSTADGPAILIRGAIMADRVKLENRDDRPFAVVFNSNVCDVRDAPGFFTWRVSEWRQAN